jgi:hypothetical protein
MATGGGLFSLPERDILQEGCRRLTGYRRRSGPAGNWVPEKLKEEFQIDLWRENQIEFPGR